MSQETTTSSAAAPGPRPTGLLRRLSACHPAARTPGQPADAGAALVLVLVVMLLGAGLASLALVAVTSQVRPLQVERKHVRALHASEAGVQVAISRLQDAVGLDPIVPGATVGVASLLPCVVGGTVVSGAVGGQPGGYTYTASIRYYTVDPTNQTAAWRASSALPCPLAVTPTYALVESTGSAPAAGAVRAGEADRTTELVYSFRTGNANAVGGTIASGSRCFDAGLGVVGSVVTLAPCGTAARQKFVWRDDLTLVLASSLATAPLCLTADPLVGTTSVAPYLAACDGLLHQSWGIDDAQRFYVIPQTASFGVLCDQGGTLVSTQACGTGFTLQQAVGSGRAGSTTASQPGRVIQWVSYAEYGRCFDVNNWNTGNDLILFPCKQDPTTSRLRWNQGWLYGAVGADGRSEVSTYYGWNGEDYAAAESRGVTRVCLDGSAPSATALRLVPCDGQPAQRLLVSREVRRSDGSVDYARSYTIADQTNRCLTVGARTSGAGGTGQWSSVRWTTCNGSEAQKWNAPPTFTPPTRTGFREGS